MDTRSVYEKKCVMLVRAVLGFPRRKVKITSVKVVLSSEKLGDGNEKVHLKGQALFHLYMDSCLVPSTWMPDVCGLRGWVEAKATQG